MKSPFQLKTDLPVSLNPLIFKTPQAEELQGLRCGVGSSGLPLLREKMAHKGKGLRWGRSEEKSSLGFSDCTHMRPFGLAGPEVTSVL